MNNTKLEEYIALTKLIAHNGPLTFQQITERISSDSEKLKEQLEFLVEQDILNSRTNPEKKTSTYVISTRGVKVLKFFSLNEPIKNGLNHIYP